jgi:hypothetical protein
MDGTSKQRKTEQEIIQLMEEFERTDALTVKEFCEAYEISYATFYNWQKVYNRSKSQNEEEVSGFVSLGVMASPEQIETSLFAEVKGIRFYKEVSASFLKELIS